MSLHLSRYHPSIRLLVLVCSSPSSQHNEPGYTRWTTVAERELPADLYPNRGWTVWELDDSPATTPQEVLTKDPFDCKPKSLGRAPGDLVIKVEQSGAPPQIVVYPVCAISISPCLPSGTVHDILPQRQQRQNKVLTRLRLSTLLPRLPPRPALVPS